MPIDKRANLPARGDLVLFEYPEGPPQGWSSVPWGLAIVEALTPSWHCGLYTVLESRSFNLLWRRLTAGLLTVMSCACSARATSSGVQASPRPPVATTAVVPDEVDCSAPTLPPSDTKVLALQASDLIGELGDALILGAIAWPEDKGYVGFYRGGRFTKLFQSSTWAFDDNHGRFFIADGTSARLFEGPDDEPRLVSIPAGQTKPYFLTDGKLVVLVDTLVHLFEPDGTLIATRDLGVSAYSLEQRGEMLLLTAPDLTVAAVDASDLAPYELSLGHPVATDDLVAELVASKGNPDERVLTIRERHTQKLRQRLTIRPPQSTYPPGRRAMHFTRHGKFFVWLEDGIHFLEIATGRHRKVTVPGGTMGYLDFGITDDGRHACLLVAHNHVTFDLSQGRALTSGPGRYVDCSMGGGRARLVDVPLRPTETISRQSHMDASFDWNDDRVAFAVWDQADPDAVGVLIVDAKTSRVEHRLRFAADPGGALIFPRIDDAFTLAYTNAGEEVSLRVSFADGSHRPIDPKEVGFLKPPSPPSTGIGYAESSVAGSTVRLAGETKSYVFRLEDFGKDLLSLDACEGVLSQGGRSLLCRPNEGPWVVHRLDDGKRFRHEPPKMKGLYVGAAVADDGMVAAFDAHQVAVSHGTGWRRHKTPDDVVHQVVWARDSRALLIRGTESLLRWSRDESAPTKLGPPPTTCGDIEVGRYGDFFRCKKTVFDVEGKPKDEPPILRLSGDSENLAIQSTPAADPVFIDADPGTGRWSYVGEHGLIRAHRGVVTLYDPKTTAKVLTFVGTDGGVIALFEDGRVDVVGQGALDAPGLVCLRGTEVAPWSSCAERWHDPQAVVRHLRCR